MNTDIYTADFFGDDYRSMTTKSSVDIVDTILSLVQPTSVIDVGCGIGIFLAEFSRRGVMDFCGVDGDWVEPGMLCIPPDKFISHNLEEPLQLNRRFDLAVCLEVAEHLPPQSAPVLVESLVDLAPVVLFSAAIPRQGGVAHLNEQWPEYWANLFAGRGYAVVDCVRRHLWTNPSVLWWYAQNTLLFVAPGVLETNERISAEFNRMQDLPLARVHPRAFLTYRDGTSGRGKSDISFRQVMSYARRWASQRYRSMGRRGPSAGEKSS